MSEKRVVVLGCGPAGLMAAHAAALQGADVRIYSKARKSHMRGAQYLHVPIPGLLSQGNRLSDSFDVAYHLQGTSDGYKEKVYGSEAADLEVSPSYLGRTHPAWDIRTAYDELWEMYGRYVVDMEITQGFLIQVGTWNADLVVSSVPAPLLCNWGGAGCVFHSTSIWSTDRAYGLADDEDNTVICNGESSPAWYRSARIQGWGTTEWPGAVPRPPLGEGKMWDVVKPISTQCACWPEIVRVGRYGAWDKRQLSHDSFFETRRVLEEMM